ncbi:UNVERIFIED_CONTAM: hypothetical protein PYX00_005090 [Menopon gallinae]|uniref:Aldehyde dehydrogenase domain-containing protein n=1 Tax=Menopon gallinae TaxID=328185 RepID=A0AAW2HR74_9NEOP
MSESTFGLKINAIYQNMSFDTVSKSIGKVWVDKNSMEDSHSAWVNGKKERNENACDLVQAAVNSSLSALSHWEKETPECRFNLLYKLAQSLHAKRGLISMLDMKMGARDSSDLFASCFNYYSDEIVPSHEEWIPVGVVMIQFSGVPAWLLALNVAAAFSAGCSVIVVTSHESSHPLLLAETCKEEGLPDGLINVLPQNIHTEKELQKYDYNGIIRLGRQPVVDESLPKNLFLGDCASLLVVNNTSSIILETCDLEGAVDTIFSETWTNYCNSWGVNLLIVQESVHQTFLDKITRKIESFTTEKKYDPTFFDDVSGKELKRILTECKKAGAKVFTPRKFEEIGCWCPVLISEYQSIEWDFHHQPALPLVMLLVCRTASEAVQLVNNSPFSLGTSVWTENLSQALDMASNIESSLVWINCHGLINASVSFEPSHRSGIGCFGGVDGALSFVKKGKLNYQLEKLDTYSMPDKGINRLRAMAEKAFDGFKKWKLNQDRKYHLKNIVSSLNEHGLSEHGQIVEFWSLNCKTYNTTFNTDPSDSVVIREKNPIGIILLILSGDSTDTEKAFTLLVTPAIAFGNVVIVVSFVNEGHPINKIIKCFSMNLPASVLSMVTGFEQATYLARDHHIQSVWALDNDLHPEMERMALAIRSCKHFWLVPKDVPICKRLIWKKCLRNKSVWMTKTTY